MIKKMCFEKKEKNWDMCSFYQIYIKNNVKMIRFIGAIDRESTGKGYLSYVYIKYFDCEVSLESLLEWDVYYQFQKLIELHSYTKFDLEPQECFDMANKLVKADGNGSIFKRLLDLTEDVPCGYYYGY